METEKHEIFNNKLDSLIVGINELKILLKVDGYTVFDLGEDIYKLLEVVRTDSCNDYMYRAGKEDAYKEVLNIIKDKVIL